MAISRQQRGPIVIGVVVLALAIASSLYWLESSTQDTTARAQLLEIGAAIELGQPLPNLAEQVVGTHLKWSRQQNDGIEWCVVATPLTFGANNWVLVIAVTQSTDTVVGVGYRTDDSLQRKPEQAPEDRVEPTIETLWADRMSA